MRNSHSYTWFSLALLWFGAAVSVAEIMTGGMIAPAGILPGTLAIFLGHIAGVLLLALIAYIGHREDMPSIMCTRISFGVRGSWLLSVANIVQLTGWTSVMIQQSGLALGGITGSLWGAETTIVSIIVMGVLIGLWSIWEAEGRYIRNTITVILLFLLTLIMSWVLWGKVTSLPQVASSSGPEMPFHKAFELSFIMPLSWAPLVADYARKAQSRRMAVLAPALGYLVGSLWMYGIGFAGALFTGTADPVPMLLASGFGVAALGIVMLSTVTTTFLDVHSAVVSACNISPRLPEKTLSVVIVAIGTAAALHGDIYESFLELIGAIFAPMSAILLVDYFLLRIDSRKLNLDIAGIVSLVSGFAAYYAFSRYGTPIGPGLASILLMFAVHPAIRKLATVFIPGTEAGR